MILTSEGPVSSSRCRLTQPVDHADQYRPRTADRCQLELKSQSTRCKRCRSNMVDGLVGYDPLHKRRRQSDAREDACIHADAAVATHGERSPQNGGTVVSQSESPWTDVFGSFGRVVSGRLGSYGRMSRVVSGRTDGCLGSSRVLRTDVSGRLGSYGSSRPTDFRRVWTEPGLRSDGRMSRVLASNRLSSRLDGVRVSVGRTDVVSVLTDGSLGSSRPTDFRRVWTEFGSLSDGLMSSLS